MVLGSAQYKRQSDDQESVGTNEDDIVSLTSEVIREDLLTPGDGVSSGSGGGAGNLGGGHVRFVDSTIRYHLNGSGANWHWRGRSGLEKALLLLTLALATFCTLMLLIVVGSFQNGPGQIHVTSHKVCVTPECVKVAAAILSAADFSVQPCDDFYKYSCGGWEKINPIPDGRTSWSMFEKLWEGNQLVMKNALEEGIRKLEDDLEAGDDAIKKVYVYYQSCMDLNGTIEASGGKPLLRILDTPGIGGWKMLQESPEPSVKDTASFERKLEILQHEFQAAAFFTWNVGEDDKNSSKHVIQIDQGGLSLPTRDYYINQTDSSSKAVVEAFKIMIGDIAKLLIKDQEGGTEQLSKDREEKLRKQAQDIVDFETKLANITVPTSQRRNEETLYNKMPISEFQEIADFLNWTKFFNAAFSKVGRNISPSEEIVVYAPSYLRNLSDLIRVYMNDSDHQLILDNYMVMQLVKSMRNTLSKAYRDAGKGLEKALLGKESHHERWRLCITDTDSVIGFALGAMFIGDSFNGNSKPAAQDMIDRIKTAFVERLGQLRWMDAETRTQALKKANAITDMIGYPDYILEEAALNEKYSRLEVRADEYFENNLRYHTYSFEENLLQLDKLVNRTRWSMTPQTVNAYYTPTKNQIVFPAGLLQNPFFNLEYPKSLNFGAMGVVMGHELSHAFDDQGREYDEMGNMRNWWNNATLQEFKNRTACMERQYSGYRAGDDNESVSGAQTLGENIADNGGLKASFYAYNRWLRNSEVEEEDPLPGINLTHHQLFFLSFSQVWCSVSTPQARTLQIREDPHSPARFRVIGVLSNSREFAQAYKCPGGSNMNPVKKCEVW